jgi:tRNA G18 (ribose-2'-O)-methylase SpoU
MRNNKEREAIPKERGYWGIGLYQPKREFNMGTLLRAANAFGAAFAFTVAERFQRQATDTSRSWRHVPIFRFHSLEDLVEHLPFNCPLVGIEYQVDGIELPRFVHPEQACYLLGAEDEGLPPEVLQRCRFAVHIPGVQFPLNVASAGVIVMYDRHAKRADRPRN